MSDEKDKPYLVFRLCKDKCLRYGCNQCGYFWGPANLEKVGQRAFWGKP